MASRIENPKQGDDRDTAPRLAVPDERIVTVEHPCIVNNVDKASDMLGGGKAIGATLPNESTQTLGLRFTPTGKDILSLNNRTDNVLLRVTVPSVIGKRKRGSGDPYQPVSQGSIHEDARFILRSMQDNPEGTIISPLGRIESSHVFRSIPDLMYSTQTSFFQHDVKAKLFSSDYDTIRQFQLPHSYGAQEDEVLPPPVLSSISFPQYYSYVDKQNTKSASATARVDDKDYIIAVNDLDSEWPTAPQPNVPPLTMHPERVQSLVELIRPIFKKRPIWTRRALINSLPPEAHVTLLRRALCWVAFYIRTGPWRDTLCRLGVDPRKDPSCAQYQTVHIRLSRLSGRALGWFRSRNPRDHFYTGQESVQQYDNRLFQLCDISDPLLIPLIANANRAECDAIHFGWYQNGTLSKIITILRAEMECSIANTPLPNLDKIITLPDQFDASGDTHPTTADTPGYFSDSASDELQDLAAEYRQTIRNAETKRTKRAEAARAGNAALADDESDSPVPEAGMSTPKPAFELAWNSSGAVDGKSGNKN
jgi:general transcription factor 3C polypeptide 5 (transcription factor C subunit 1)